MSHHNSVQLPEEMITEILLRVPSKSLIRFKCVCQPWRSLFSSPDFLAKHLLPDSEDDDFLLVKRRDCPNRHYFLSLLSNRTLSEHPQTLCLPPDPEIPDVDSYYRVEIVGSCCNGLICIAYDNLQTTKIAIWSVATREAKFLPPSHFPYPPGAAFFSIPDHGFLYDSDSQDYIVIRIADFAVQTGDGQWAGTGLQVEIYSYNSDSWRVVDLDVDHLPYLTEPLDQKVSVYTNGVFSWLAHNRERQFDWIIWFRVRDESFGTTMLPPNRFDPNRFDAEYHPNHFAPYFYYCKHFTTNLLVLNEQTIGCIVFDRDPEPCVSHLERRFRVWALLEFGVEESWTPLFTLGPLVGIEYPLWFWKNGKTLMENVDGDLILCDPFNHDMKSLNICKFPYKDFYRYKYKLNTQIVKIPAKYILE